MAIRAGCPIAFVKRAIFSCSSVYFFFILSIPYLFVVRKNTNTLFINQMNYHILIFKTLVIPSTKDKSQS